MGSANFQVWAAKKSNKNTVTLNLAYSVFAYYRFAYSVLAYSVFAYSVFAYSLTFPCSPIPCSPIPCSPIPCLPIPCSDKGYGCFNELKGTNSYLVRSLKYVCDGQILILCAELWDDRILFIEGILVA